MSIQAIAWVIEHSEAKLGARLVLLSIANHADARGENAFPAVETIAREARMSARTVQYAIKELERSGELVIERGAGRSGTHLFTLPGIMQPGLPLKPRGAKSAPSQNLQGCNPEQGGVQDTTKRGEESAPKPSLTVIEPSKEEEPKGSGPSQFDPKLLVAVWEEVCGASGLAVPRSVEGARLVAMRARYRETFGEDIGQWRAYCERIVACPFLLGENDRGWKADIDFALKASKATKILEGAYDRAAGQVRAGPRHWNDHGTETGMSPTVEGMILNEQRTENRNCNDGAPLLAADSGASR